MQAGDPVYPHWKLPSHRHPGYQRRTKYLQHRQSWSRRWFLRSELSLPPQWCHTFWMEPWMLGDMGGEMWEWYQGCWLETQIFNLWKQFWGWGLRSACYLYRFLFVFKYKVKGWVISSIFKKLPIMGERKETSTPKNLRGFWSLITVLSFIQRAQRVLRAYQSRWVARRDHLMIGTPTQLPPNTFMTWQTSHMHHDSFPLFFTVFLQRSTMKNAKRALSVNSGLREAAAHWTWSFLS